MSERVLVTGAGGYLGRVTVAHLRARGVEAVATARRAGSNADVAAEVCELSDHVAVQHLIERVAPTAVVHAAAWIGPDSVAHEAIQAAHANNVSVTANLVEACSIASVARFIFCSSVEVYAPAPINGIAHREGDALNPQGLYGKTKASGEHIVRALEGTPTRPLVLRMPGLHGAPRRSGFVFHLIDAAVRGQPVDLAEPDTRLSFLWVSDAARVITSAALGELTQSHPVLNLANGDATLAGLAACIGKLTGRPLDIRRGTKPARSRALDVTRLRTMLPYALPAFEDGLAGAWHAAQAA